MKLKNELTDIIKRYENNPIITKESIPYRMNSVFNAAATTYKNKTLLLLRIEDRNGISHLTTATSIDGKTGWEIDKTPTFMPDIKNHPEEEWGIEDPRITYLEEKKVYAIAYTSYSADGSCVSLATTTDFKTLQRLGPVLLPDNKDAALFPEKINGRWAIIHRPTPPKPGLIWISFSPDLIHWGDHKCLLRNRGGGMWDGNKIGLNNPPLRTDKGWLILYHGIKKSASGSVYRLGLALLDINDPTIVLERAGEWVFAPEEDYEKAGDVSNVVFPCGWIQKDDEVWIYYGCADTCISLATAKIDDLLSFLETYNIMT